jgi:dimethylamine/trimethylamine dehydrogenase
VTGDFSMTPSRCTQNPAMGEEWRRGWHPDRIRPKTGDAHVLVVGAGPAGLEAARALGARGIEVTVADAARVAGGRVARECKLPGLAAWGRVRDWRLGQIAKMSNVSLYLESAMTPEAIAEVGADHILIATGATWRRDGTGAQLLRPIAVAPGAEVLTPDDLMKGLRPKAKHVTIFDDDHYYMGGVLAELLRKEGHDVTLLTPAALVSNYTKWTLEQERIQARMIELGVAIMANLSVTAIEPDELTLACVFTGRQSRAATGATLLVTARDPVDGLYLELAAKGANVSRAGDCLGPSTIAAAVHAGRRFAEEFGETPLDFATPPFRREVTALT